MRRCRSGYQKLLCKRMKIVFGNPGHVFVTLILRSVIVLIGEVSVVYATVQEPFNAEPPAAALVNSYITHEDIFYKRNHGPIPILLEPLT